MLCYPDTTFSILIHIDILSQDRPIEFMRQYIELSKVSEIKEHVFYAIKLYTVLNTIINLDYR